MSVNGSFDSYFEKNRGLVSKRQAFPGISSGNLHDQMFSLYSTKNDYITWSYERQDYALEDNDKTMSEYWLRAEETTSFFILLGIFFPSVTGIMAGSNRSGDLKNPQKAIPLGTIAAVLTTSFIYLLMTVLFIATTDRLLLLDKYGKSLSPEGGMVASYMSFPRKTSYDIPTATEIGALLSTLGAGLQALTGAPRLLQAIAKDGHIPFLIAFGKMSSHGEPVRALILTIAISELGILIGQLDLIAPLLSMFFLLFYAGVNLACVVMSISNNPGWRPTFKCYHWSVSFIGVAYCIGIMFSISYLLAILAIAIFCICFFLIQFYGGVEEWGSGVEGLALSFATKLIKVHRKNQAGKNWRPQILHIIHLTKTRAQVYLDEISNDSRVPPPFFCQSLTNELCMWRIDSGDSKALDLIGSH